MSQQLVRFINFGIAPDAPEKPDHGRRLYLLPNGDFATIDEAGVITPLATDWDSITGKPSVFPPEAHSHTSARITDFAEAVVAVSPPVDWSSLTGKPSAFPPESHTHPANQITGLNQFIDATRCAHKRIARFHRMLVLSFHGHARTGQARLLSLSRVYQNR